MNVREKLVKIVKKAAYFSLPSNTEDFHLDRFVTNLLAYGVTVQEWISVKDRLPECEGSYIVYTERGSIYASHFYAEKRFASGYVREAQWSQRGTVKVTHWMPLPQPPKGE